MRRPEACELLGVTEKSTPAEIKKAYKKQALKTHPDKNPDDENAKAKFQRVSEAYRCLTDPQYQDDEDGGMPNEEEVSTLRPPRPPHPPARPPRPARPARPPAGHHPPPPATTRHHPHHPPPPTLRRVRR